MKTKTIKTFYWIVTSIFCLANLGSGISGFFPNKQGLDVMIQLGYPAYLLIIIGIAKILGSVAVIQTKFKTIKEWAYAGFTIDYIGASTSFIFVNGEIFAIILPIIFLTVLFASYISWKKLNQ